VHINPDHFLQTERGRVITHERNMAAWEQSYVALHAALRDAGPATKVYVLVGPQGSGKSTWARSRHRAEPDAIFFDAILVKRSERRPILTAAHARSVRAIAVWFTAPLEVCLARNAARPEDELVPERAIRNVHAAVEPPDLDEGFERILEVHVDDAGG
jgi:predicted kinase